MVSKCNNSLLLVGGGLSTGRGGLLLLLGPSSLALQLAGGLDLLEQADDLGILHLLGNGGSLDLWSGRRKLGNSALQLDGGLLLGVDDHASQVRLEALGVELQGLLRLVAAAVVNGDALGLSLHLGNASGLQLLKGEATSSANLRVVSLGRAVDGGAKEAGSRARSNGSGLLLANTCALSLANGLVQPDLHT